MRDLHRSIVVLVRQGVPVLVHHVVHGGCISGGAGGCDGLESQVDGLGRPRTQRANVAPIQLSVVVGVVGSNRGALEAQFGVVVGVSHLHRVQGGVAGVVNCDSEDHLLSHVGDAVAGRQQRLAHFVAGVGDCHVGGVGLVADTVPILIHHVVGRCRVRGIAGQGGSDGGESDRDDLAGPASERPHVVPIQLPAGSGIGSGAGALETQFGAVVCIPQRHRVQPCVVGVGDGDSEDHLLSHVGDAIGGRHQLFGKRQGRLGDFDRRVVRGIGRGAVVLIHRAAHQSRVGGAVRPGGPSGNEVQSYCGRLTGIEAAQVAPIQLPVIGRVAGGRSGALEADLVLVVSVLQRHGVEGRDPRVGDHDLELDRFPYHRDAISRGNQTF